MIRRAGDRAWLVECEDATALAAAVRAEAAWGTVDVVDVVPAAGTVLVSARTPAAMASLRDALRRLRENGPDEVVHTPPRTVEIPVQYDGADLATVAEAVAMSTAEVVAAHATAEHRVTFFGFAPGVAYIEGTPGALRLPRLASPRPRVAAGVVAIAGTQTIVYPGGTPGGWHQIGTSPMRLWDVHAEPPSALRPGDRVRFVEVR